MLLTHEHKDHIGGLDDIRAFNWVKNGEVDIYCNRRTKDIICKDYDYAFAEFRYPGVPDVYKRQALANASLKASKLPNDLSINSFIFPVGTTCAALWGWKVSK